MNEARTSRKLPIFGYGAVIALLTVLNVSCRSGSTVVDWKAIDRGSFPNHTVQQILGRLPTMPDDLHALYAEASIALSSPEEKGRFSARISYRRDDSLLVKLRFALGIEGARVLVTRDSAFVYDRIHNELLFGSADRMSAALPGAIFGMDLVESALNYVQPDPAIEWRLSVDSLRYHLTAPDSTLIYDIDPRLWRIVRIEHRDPSGMVLEQRWYTRFRKYNQYILPQRLSLSRPQEDTRLSMVLRKVEPEAASLSFDLGLKEDTRRIHIR